MTAAMDEERDDRLSEALARLAATEPTPAVPSSLARVVRQEAGRRSRRRRTLAIAALIAPIGLGIFLLGGRREVAVDHRPTVDSVEVAAARNAAREELAELDAELARIERRITRLQLAELEGKDLMGLEPKVVLRVRFEGEAARLASLAEMHSAEPLIAEPLRDAVRRIYPDTSAGRQLARAPAPHAPPNES